MKDKITVYVVSEAHTYRDENDDTTVVTYGDAARDMKTARKILRSLVWMAISEYYEGAELSNAEIEKMVREVIRNENRVAHSFRWESGWDMYQWCIEKTEI